MHRLSGVSGRRLRPTSGGGERLVMFPQPPTPFAQQPLPAGSPQQPPPLPPGAVLLGRYRIESYIGGGGFAHIYRAHDERMGYIRAIKEAFYRDPATQRQFGVEAEILLNTT